MNPKIAMTRLSARISQFNTLGIGGHAHISWDDIAAALPKSPLQSLLIRVKWTGENRFWPDLVWWTLRELWHPEWRTQDPKRPQRLVEIALRDFIDPNLCHRCGGHEIEGRTIVWSNNNGRVARTCPSCQGTGIKRARSGRSLAKIIGVDEKTWRECWRERFSILEADLNTVESSALKTLEKNLFSE